MAFFRRGISNLTSKTFFCVFILSLFINPGLSATDSNECGSLITYRQHSVLLSEAPRCLSDGCGQNTSTMSSGCSTDSPCFRLWELMRRDWQQPWCDSCQKDTACRIGGWPILNMTETCETMPQAWIFYNENGPGCCTDGNEPFILANWTTTLCNGSEWNSPFNYYGSMAREDWEEWIEPWNWTVRIENSTREVQQELLQCASASTYLWSYGIDNLLTLATALGSFFVRVFLGPTIANFTNRLPSPITWIANQLFDNPGEPEVWIRVIFAGASDAALLILSDMSASFLIKLTPGYQDVPVGKLTLLLASRPRIVAIVCSLALMLPHIENNYPWLHRRLSPASAYNIAAAAAVAELIMQAVGSVYLGRTANTGRKKGFYLVNHLTPYWRGKDAYRMYIGGIIWTILSPVILVGLFLTAWAHLVHGHIAAKLYPTGEDGWLTKPWRKFLAQRDRYYGEKWYANYLQKSSTAAQPSAGVSVLSPPHNTRAGTVPPNPLDDLLISTTSVMHSSRAISSLIGMHLQSSVLPANPIVLPATLKAVHTPQQRGPTPSRSTKRSRILTYWPFEWFICFLFVCSEGSISEPVSGQPAQYNFLRQRAYDKPTLRALRRFINKSQEIMVIIFRALMLFTLFTVLVCYAAQWLFWSGFVESMGDRYVLGQHSVHQTS